MHYEERLEPGRAGASWIESHKGVHQLDSTIFMLVHRHHIEVCYFQVLQLNFLHMQRGRVGLVQVGLSPKKELVTHRETMAARREAELQLFYHRIHQYKPTTTILQQSYFKLSTTQTVLAFFKPRSHGLIKMNSVKIIILDEANRKFANYN